MSEKTNRLYAALFAKPFFERFNKKLFFLSLRGLGILNYETKQLSGEFDWLKRYLKPLKFPVVFDVGANVGLYTQDILEICPASIIYAFEPHPKNFAHLKKTVGSQANIFNVALGQELGELQLYDYLEKDGSTHASLYRDVIEEIRHEPSIKYDVIVKTLDDFCCDHKIGIIDLLKIDVEGHELQCLMGSSNLLREGKIRAIQLEFNEMNIISRSTFKDFWDLLTGFKLYRLLPSGRLLLIEEYNPIYCEIYAYQNIVALKN